MDRGYLEIARNQNVDDITNIIQYMLRLGVKFLGTVKNSTAFPFFIKDMNEKKRCNHKNKVVIQSYGTRSSFTAETRLGNHRMKVWRSRN